MIQQYKITYRDSSIVCKRNESLLDAFFRNKVDVPFSCRNGSCQACLIHVRSGNVTKTSQSGLSSHLVQTNHILPCMCFPESDMELEPPISENIYNNTKILKIMTLSENIKEVIIEPDTSILKYKTGQFINIKTDLDSRVRSYSLTSRFNLENKLSFHVQKINNGLFSHWVFKEAQVGDDILIHYPLGACYNSNNTDVSGKLFIATGSGLGACVAIISEILNRGYNQEIKLYHSSKNDSGLYLTDDLTNLINKYSNLKFHQNVTKEKSENEQVSLGYADRIAMENIDQMGPWEVYLYGNPVMVKAATKLALSKGCNESNIYSDAFEYGQTVNSNDLQQFTDSMEFVEEEKINLKPDFKLWDVLIKDNRLNKILDDFYTKVLSDPLLAPFFKGVTKQHIMGKQYAFLNQVFTGSDSYFGDRPRNAHHWMVISNELFDYREKLFAESCIKYDLKPPYLTKLLDFDESFRKAIVKTKVWPKITDGEIKAIKGFEEMVLEIGALCNVCEQVLNSGESVHYHDRTGEIFCQTCKQGGS